MGSTCSHGASLLPYRGEAQIVVIVDAVSFSKCSGGGGELCCRRAPGSVGHGGHRRRSSHPGRGRSPRSSPPDPGGLERFAAIADPAASGKAADRLHPEWGGVPWPGERGLRPAGRGAGECWRGCRCGRGTAPAAWPASERCRLWRTVAAGTCPASVPERRAGGRVDYCRHGSAAVARELRAADVRLMSGLNTWLAVPVRQADGWLRPLGAP